MLETAIEAALTEGYRYLMTAAGPRSLLRFFKDMNNECTMHGWTFDREHMLLRFAGCRIHREPVAEFPLGTS